MTSTWLPILCMQFELLFLLVRVGRAGWSSLLNVIRRFNIGGACDPRKVPRSQVCHAAIKLRIPRHLTPVGWALITPALGFQYRYHSKLAVTTSEDVVLEQHLKILLYVRAYEVFAQIRRLDNFRTEIECSFMNRRCPGNGRLFTIEIVYHL